MLKKSAEPGVMTGHRRRRALEAHAEIVVGVKQINDTTQLCGRHVGAHSIDGDPQARAVADRRKKRIQVDLRRRNHAQRRGNRELPLRYGAGAIDGYLSDSFDDCSALYAVGPRKVVRPDGCGLDETGCVSECQRDVGITGFGLSLGAAGDEKIGLDALTGGKVWNVQHGHAQTLEMTALKSR